MTIVNIYNMIGSLANTDNTKDCKQIYYLLYNSPNLSVLKPRVGICQIFFTSLSLAKIILQ